MRYRIRLFENEYQRRLQRPEDYQRQFELSELDRLLDAGTSIADAVRSFARAGGGSLSLDAVFDFKQNIARAQLIPTFARELEARADHIAEMLIAIANATSRAASFSREARS